MYSIVLQTSPKNLRQRLTNIIDINPLPGIIPDPNENSSFPKAARAAGIEYNDMINTVLASAVKRYNLL